MADNTTISWTEATWNPVVGCTYASPGCLHCYARTVHDRRFLAWKRGTFPGAPAQYHMPFKEVQLLPERLDIPLRWKKPKKVFVNSVSDLFHEQVPVDFIKAVFGVMALTPWHIYQILTKRPERMREVVSQLQVNNCVTELLGTPGLKYQTVSKAYDKATEGLGRRADGKVDRPWPLPNVWLGTSVENQDAADSRIGELLQTPAAVHFVSYEPALGPVDFTRVKWPGKGEHRVDVLRGGFWDTDWGFVNHHDFPARLGWIIVGGESGSKHRPFDLDWARRTRDQCVAAGAAFWFKQSGGSRPEMNPTLDGETWHQFPTAS